MSHGSDFDWLPERGVILTRRDLERILIDLRALVDGTDPVEPNRAHALDIASTLADELEREEGGP